MPLTLYYLPPSPPARSVALMIHTLNLPVEYKVINLQEKEQFAPEFLKLNPLHTVPVIDDDGFVLWESRAIMTYLVSKYAKDDALYPKDIEQRAVVDQRLHYSNDAFYVAREITRGLIYTDATGVTEDQVQKVKNVQENIEKLLEGHKFIAGDSLTVTDYSYVTIIDLLEIYNPGDNYPLTKAWFERCKSAIPDFDKVNNTGAAMLTGHLKQKLGQATKEEKKD